MLIRRFETVARTVALTQEHIYTKVHSYFIPLNICEYQMTEGGRGMGGGGAWLWSFGPEKASCHAQMPPRVPILIEECVICSKTLSGLHAKRLSFSEMVLFICKAQTILSE